jgi:hypothetical protein
MPRKRKPTKLDVFKSRIADARRIIDMQQALLEKLRKYGETIKPKRRYEPTRALRCTFWLTKRD